MKLLQLLQDLECAAEEFRPGVFWFWNDELDDAALAREVDAFAAAGIRRLVLHPIHGMTVEYLSDLYCHKVKFALECCRKQHIQVWLYDEFGWPSGNVGGLLLQQHPEFKGWHLRFSRDAAGQVHAEPQLTERILDNTTGAPWCQCDSGYLDTLSAAAVGAFITMTHERLLAAIGPELFAATVLGFFTDEPAAMMDSAGKNSVWEAEALPWTPELPERFRQRYGFAIEPHYAELAAPANAELRRQYWDLATELHIANFYQAIGDWCRAHQVQFTGHLGDDLPVQQARFAGNLFLALQQMDIPGWDYLGSRQLTNAAYALQMTAVASAAKAAGKDRVFCEVFGVSPQDITPEEMLAKAQLFGLYGINMLYFMGAHQSLKGSRKHLYWPPLFTEAPWFAGFDALRAAIGRAQALVHFGRRLNRYAIVYPQDQLQQLPVLDYKPWDEPVQQTLQAVIDALQQRGESFDFVFRETLTPETAREYGEVIALDDFYYEPATLAKLTAAGARRISAAQFIAGLAQTEPSHRRYLDWEPHPELRVFVFAYEDGAVLALHHAGTGDLTVKLRSQTGGHAYRYDAVEGSLTAADTELRFGTESTVLLLVSNEPLLPPSAQPAAGSVTVTGVAADYQDNLIGLQRMRFRHLADQTWHTGADRHTAIKGQALPVVFFGTTQAGFEGEFTLAEAFDDLEVVFESGYLQELRIDGAPLALQNAAPGAGWEAVCRRLPLPRLTAGKHTLSGVMCYPQFESSMKNDAYFQTPPMPSLDLCLGGHFLAGADGALRHGALPGALPLELGQSGLPHALGVVTVTVTVAVTAPCDSIALELYPNTTARVAVGTQSCWSLTAPHRVPLHLPAGEHQLTVELYPTTAHLFSAAALPWGLKNIHA